MPFLHPRHFFLAVALECSTIQARSYQEPSSPERTQSSCANVSTTTFSEIDFFYQRIEQAPNLPDGSLVNLTSLVFGVVNEANGVVVRCDLTRASHDNKWADVDNYWYPCADQTYELDGVNYAITTKANFVFDKWKLSVNQSWNCDSETVIRHIANTTLEPSCEETKTPWQYVQYCDLPNITIPATPQPQPNGHQ